MHSFLLLLLLLLLVGTTLCLGHPTSSSSSWWKRLLIPSIQVNVSQPDTSISTSTSTSTPTPTPTPTPPATMITNPPSNPSNPSIYEVFTTGHTNCKQGFIGNINAPACWSSTCGPWSSLEIRQIYNATITMYPTTACTGPAEKINPICAPADIEQDCAFAGQRFLSFRVVPGCAQTASNDGVCQRGLQEVDCGEETCLGSLIGS